MANRITTVVEYAVRDAIKSLQDTQKELGKTEVSGKDLADALRRAADDAEREMGSISRASSAMEQALGADFVEARRQAGVSVDDIVMELSNLGVSFDQIETDAKDLADAVKRLDDVRAPIKNVGDEAKTAATKIDAVRDSGDQSRSVLANLVGNSAQDLGELGGFAGTAGVALGQLAEYAVDGNIQLSNLAKVAAPMALLTAAGLGLNAVMNAQRKAAEDLRRETELLVEVERARRDNRMEEVAEKLAEEYRDTLPILEKYGMGVREIDEVLSGNTESIDELREMQRRYSGEQLNAIGLTHDERAALGDKVIELNKVINTLEEADTAQGNAREQVERADAANQAWTEYLKGDTTPALKGAERATKDVVEVLIDAGREIETVEEKYRKLTEELSDEEAWLSAQESLRQFREDMASGELSALEQRQAIVDLKGSLLDYLTSLEGVPPEKQSEIIALIDQGAFDDAERALNNLARERGVPLVAQPGGMGAGIKYRASGGPVSRGDTVVVGEEGPELLHMGSNGYVSPNSVFNGAGGGQTIINIRTNADPQSTVNAQRRAARRGTRFR